MAEEFFCPGGLDSGDLYNSPSGGSLGASHSRHGVNVANFSFGQTTNVYDSLLLAMEDPSVEDHQSIEDIQSVTPLGRNLRQSKVGTTEFRAQ